MALAVTESKEHQKRHYTCMKNVEGPQAKSVKRQRTESNTSVLGKTQSIQQEEWNSTSAPKTVKRSSRFRGVSKHKWTGRYEAHLWDKFTWNVTQKKKGKQVYLGAYNDEEAAARAYDLASLKYWGLSTFTNFPIYNYEKEIEIMQTATKEEYLASLRRKSSGFSRGASMYRGVARHHQNGRWEARIGRVFGNKYLYLGTFSTQEEAARAYDLAAIECVGINAITNFDMSTYIEWLKRRTNNSIPVQKAKASTESKESKLQSSYLQPKPCRINTMSMQEQGNITFSSCKKSASPTALSLLLRSSVFKELVEKNSNLSEEESDDEITNDLQQASSHNAHGNVLYYIPFSHYTNNHWIELQG